MCCVPHPAHVLCASPCQTYEFSKLKKFLTLTRFIMEDTLRFLVEDSLHKFSSFIQVQGWGQGLRHEGLGLGPRGGGGAGQEHREGQWLKMLGADVCTTCAPSVRRHRSATALPHPEDRMQAHLELTSPAQTLLAQTLEQMNEPLCQQQHIGLPTFTCLPAPACLPPFTCLPLPACPPAFLLPPPP